MINQFSRAITNELIGRRPQSRLLSESISSRDPHLVDTKGLYRKDRWAELHEKVTQILLESFDEHFPTLMRAYREEQRLQHAIQPTAEPRDEGVRQHESDPDSGTEGSRGEVVSPVPRLGPG